MPLQRGLEQAGEHGGQLLNPVPAHASPRQSRQGLRGLVEHRDAPPSTHDHHAVFDGGERLLQLLVDLHHALVRLRVPDGDGGLVREGLQQVGIVAEVGIPRSLGPHGDKTEKPPLLDQRSEDVDTIAVHLSESFTAVRSRAEFITKNENLCASRLFYQGR